MARYYIRNMNACWPKPKLVLLTFLLWGKLLLQARGPLLNWLLIAFFVTRSAASSIYASIASTE